ncbi:hypothetical protein [Xenorhabdus indica]|uniref:hypothetical protein n=1 Tax=Xenorhabdus indica TaxID=333964 RepID=UPI001656A0F0|nr:hypothetical protein [Xenorhabdus indica]MBC8947023.1 hypothetical protein [Xenorhabdus indica]
MKLLFSVLSILAISTSISGCVPTQKPFSMDYKTDNKTFHLTKSCIENISPNEKNNTIFIKIKNNDSCSKPFNTFWKKSIGKKVSVLFNNSFILKEVYSNTPIQTENGFHQAINSISEFKKIINSLK